MRRRRLERDRAVSRVRSRRERRALRRRGGRRRGRHRPARRDARARARRRAARLELYVLCDDGGQISEAHSISAGLDYPGVGPEHAFLKDTGRAKYCRRPTRRRSTGFQRLARTEGILPALETAHAVRRVPKDASSLPERRRRHRERVGARRQGHGHDRRAPRCDPVSRLLGDLRASEGAEARGAGHLSDRPGSRRRHEPPVDARRCRGGRRHHRGRRSVERSVRGRQGDPGGDPPRDRERRRHDQVAGALPRAPAGASERRHRSVRVREPDRRHGAGGVRGRGARRRRGRGPVRRLSRRRGRRADGGAREEWPGFHSAAGADVDAGPHRRRGEGRERLHLLCVADRHHRHASFGHGRAARAGDGDPIADGRQGAGGGRLRHQDAGRRARRGQVRRRCRRGQRGRRGRRDGDRRGEIRFPSWPPSSALSATPSTVDRHA